MNEEFTMADLADEWYELNDYKKNRYAFGNEKFDRTVFADLIRRTLEGLISFKEQVLGKGSDEIHILDNVRNVTPYDIEMHSVLTAQIAKYSADVYTDESDEYIFTASLIITRFLLRYATYFIAPIDKKGVLSGRAEFADIYPPAEDEDYEFWDRTFHFDTYTGDYSEVLELAQRYNQLF